MSMLQLEVQNGVDKGHRFELRTGSYRFGRNNDNDFAIDDPTVSSTHCEIQVADGVLSIRDLGSTNGTFIDGRQVTEGKLLPGQTLKLGDIEMALQPAINISIPKIDLAEPPPPAALPDGSAACVNHPTAEAIFFCPDCGKNFCVTCVHKLRRSGGHFLILCPSCSAQCQLVPGKEARKKKKSLFGLLRHTLKIKQ